MISDLMYIREHTNVCALVGRYAHDRTSPRLTLATPPDDTTRYRITTTTTTTTK